MALPVTISGVLMAPRTDHAGPFISSGGNVYVIVLDSTDTSLIEAWKATDPTDSFAEQNSAGKPDLTNLVTAMSVYQVADVLHIATQEAVTSRVAYHTFNMATDAWAIVNETVDAMGGTAVLVTMVSIVLRSDGDVIILYAGALETVTMTAQQRVDYARRESAVWTAGVQVDNGGSDDWLPGTAVLGSSDRSHFGFINDDLDDGYQRTLTSANALETFPAAFDTSIQSLPGNIDIGPGVTYVSGGATKVRFPCEFGDNIVGSVQCDSADAPSMSGSQISAADAPLAANNRYLSAMAVDNLRLYALWVNAATNDLFYDQNLDDAGWGTDATLFTGTVTMFTPNVYTRSGTIRLAYLMTDAGAVKYNELDLAAPGTYYYAPQSFLSMGVQ